MTSHFSSNHTKTACTCFQWLLSQWKCFAMTVPPLWVGKLSCWVSLKCNDYFYYRLMKSHFVSFTLLLYCRCYLMAYLWKKCQCQWQWMVLCYRSWPCTLLLQKKRWYISQYQWFLITLLFYCKYIFVSMDSKTYSIQMPDKTCTDLRLTSNDKTIISLSTL